MIVGWKNRPEVRSTHAASRRKVAILIWWEARMPGEGGTYEVPIQSMESMIVVCFSVPFPINYFALTGWQVGRLAGWQVGRLVGYQVGRSEGWQVGRLAG